jgi:hypothetical protein
MKKTSVILSIIITISFYLVGGDIPISEQIPLYDSLRNTSAIIFGVMGAWIAILYPNALLKIYGKLEIENSEKESKNIRQLISPMILSTFIVSFVLIVGLASPVLRRITFMQQHTELLRSLSFAFLGVLTFLQLWALLSTLAPSNMIQKSIDFTINKRKKIKQILPKSNE